MGIWTGMLNNKVGSFKFIYVDVLPEKEKEEEEDAPKNKTCESVQEPTTKYTPGVIRETSFRGSEKYFMRIHNKPET